MPDKSPSNPDPRNADPLNYAYRWVARRPPSAMPAKPTSSNEPPGPTPAYTRPPQWTLYPSPGNNHGGVITSRKRHWLDGHSDAVVTVTISILGAAAIIELIRFLLMVVNRDHFFPWWVALSANGLASLLGWVAMLLVSASVLVLGRRLISLRRVALTPDRIEPRPTWQLWVYIATPVVNLITLGVLLTELVQFCGSARQPSENHSMSRIVRRWWIGWVVLNVLAVIGISYRFGGSVQTIADGLEFTAIFNACSALFAWWSLRLSRRLAVDVGALKGADDSDVGSLPGSTHLKRLVHAA